MTYLINTVHPEVLEGGMGSDLCDCDSSRERKKSGSHVGCGMEITNDKRANSMNE